MYESQGKARAARMLRYLEYLGLVVIALATVVAAGGEVMVMVRQGHVTLADLLLMFLYLEVLSMVGAYLTSGHLPVRMPLYIAIVAMARYLILDIHHMDWPTIIAVAVAMLILAGTVLVIRFGHLRFPYGDVDAAWRGDRQDR